MHPLLILLIAFICFGAAGMIAERNKLHTKRTCACCHNIGGYKFNRSFPVSDGYVCESCLYRAGIDSRSSNFNAFAKLSSQELNRSIREAGGQTGARQAPSQKPSAAAPPEAAPEMPQSEPAAGSMKTHQGMTFRLPVDFEYSENGNTAVLTAPQNHTVFVIAANVIKSPSAESEPGLIHSLAVESFIGQFENIRHREDFETGRGKATRVGANFSGRLNDGEYHCSITSLMNGPTQYSVSYACRVQEGQAEAHYRDYQKLLQGLRFT